MAHCTRTNSERAFVLSVGVDPVILDAARARATHWMECERAASAREAIERARSRTPELVIIGGDALWAAATLEEMLDDASTERASFVAVPIESAGEGVARLTALGAVLAPRSADGLRRACDLALDAREGRTVALSSSALPDSNDPSASVELEGKRVVVADDDPAIVWFVGDVLRARHAEVVEACDGAVALGMARRSAPDLVLADIQMPRVDGPKLCAALRDDPILSDTPVVLLSWHRDWLLRAQDEGANAASYLTKRSTPEEILICARNALQGHERLERRMRGGAAVRGRLDGISPYRVLRLTCLARSNARVAVRDRERLYDVRVRAGAPRSAAMLSSDGSAARGQEALTAMLAARSGRFSVSDDASSIEFDLKGTLREQMARGVTETRMALRVAVPEQVSAGQLLTPALPALSDLVHSRTAASSAPSLLVTPEAPVRTLPLLGPPYRSEVGRASAAERTLPLVARRESGQAGADPRGNAPTRVRPRHWTVALQCAGVAGIAILGWLMGVSARAYLKTGVEPAPPVVARAVDIPSRSAAAGAPAASPARQASRTATGSSMPR
jgi:two-component system alkaline phosphatase synthesis response regulator PhoP